MAIITNEEKIKSVQRVHFYAWLEDFITGFYGDEKYQQFVMYLKSLGYITSGLLGTITLWTDTGDYYKAFITFFNPDNRDMFIDYMLGRIDASM